MTAHGVVRRALAEQGTDDCILWNGCFNQDGYGQAKLAGRSHTAHRAVWITANGPIPAGLEVDHLCRVRACVNLRHLELVTRAENKRRARELNSACRHGHEFTPENTGRSRGYRYCRTCRRESQQRTAAKYRAITASRSPKARRLAAAAREDVAA